MFLVESGVDLFMIVINHCTRVPSDCVVALLAMIIGDWGVSSDANGEFVFVIRDRQCCFVKIDDKFECLSPCDKVIVVYTKDSFMFRSRFSSVGQAGAAGGVAHGQVSSFAEITVPHSSEHSRKAVLSQSPQQRQQKSKKDNRQ